VLYKRPDGLAGSFEKKANNRANQPGQHGTELRANVFEAFPQSFAAAFKAFVIVPMTAPIVIPAATRIVANVKPFSLKSSLTFSRQSDCVFSLASISVCKGSISLFQSATFSSAASLSEGDASGSSIVAWASAFRRSCRLRHVFQSNLRRDALYSKTSQPCPAHLAKFLAHLTVLQRACRNFLPLLSPPFHIYPHVILDAQQYICTDKDYHCVNLAPPWRFLVQGFSTIPVKVLILVTVNV